MWQRVTCLVGVLLFSNWAIADINDSKPPFGLTVSQALAWSSTSEFADANNVSQVPLAPRFKAIQTQLNSSLNPDVQVLIAPDGMNNFANYLVEQEQFNLYNFTHWAQIDVLNWFAGTADLTVNIPARPWVESAHRNGVKVIGSIYLAVAQWGGSADTAEAFLVRDEQGRFLMAHQLIEMATYYGFDGWLMNQETDLSAVKDASNQLVKGVKDYNRAAFLGREMLAFMTYLTSIAPDDMEIHWYDAQLVDGTVVWQNELNERNAPFFGTGLEPASDAIFINYWWDKAMVEQSQHNAKKMGRNPYAVYTGVDLWPARSAQKAFVKTQWLDDIFSDPQQQGLTSIALFGNNVNYNFSGHQDTPAYSQFQQSPSDYQSFYDTETRLFSGDNLNIADVQQAKWQGLSRYIPARSVLSQLPFRTSFNTGHGLSKVNKGNKVSASPWHDMSQQDILPSWQFAIFGSKQIEVRYDFETVFDGGSSLYIGGDASQQTVIPMYKTKFNIANEQLAIVTKGQGNIGVELSFYDGSSALFPLASKAQWHTTTIDLQAFASKTMTRISFVIDESQSRVSLNIGNITIE